MAGQGSVTKTHESESLYVVCRHGLRNRSIVTRGPIHANREADTVFVREGTQRRDGLAL